MRSGERSSSRKQQNWYKACLLVMQGHGEHCLARAKFMEIWGRGRELQRLCLIWSLTMGWDTWHCRTFTQQQGNGTRRSWFEWLWRGRGWRRMQGTVGLSRGAWKHVFGAEDKSHCRTEEIYGMLHAVGWTNVRRENRHAMFPSHGEKLWRKHCATWGLGHHYF